MVSMRSKAMVRMGPGARGRDDFEESITPWMRELEYFIRELQRAWTIFTCQIHVLHLHDEPDWLVLVTERMIDVHHSKRINAVRAVRDFVLDHKPSRSCKRRDSVMNDGFRQRSRFAIGLPSRSYSICKAIRATIRLPPQ